jgi:uncharacterized repeat protein (TIGR03803 family)
MSTGQCVYVVDVNKRHIILSLVMLLLAACGGSSGRSDAVLQTIAVSPSSASQVPGTTLQLIATGTYADGTTRNVSSAATWTSSKSAVASINATGTVTAVAIGSATIIATIGTVAGQTTITVPSGARIESVLHAFGSTPSDGLIPSPLIQASDGNYYGITITGGANPITICYVPYIGCGTVFRVTPTGTETVTYSFGILNQPGFDAGNTPTGALLQARDGSLYGTATVGGQQCPYPHSFSCGTVYKISPDGTVSLLYGFGASPSDGAIPTGSLVQGADGNLYGTTTFGGANSCGGQSNDCGTVFRVTPAGDEQVLHSFDVSGSSPQGALIQGADGNLYGTTVYGGNGYTAPFAGCAGCNSGAGTVFKLTPAGLETVLYSFGASVNDGSNPNGGVIQASDGNFYGVTRAGGANGAGTVYKLTPAGVETVLYSFGASPSDGSNPNGELIQATDGNFYGVTTGGGNYFSGTLFMITPAGAATVLYSFGASDSDGRYPVGPLIQAADGNFYGVTSYGGVRTTNADSGGGTVFKFVP